MSEWFTYIIRSEDRTNSTDKSASCTIKLTGLPSEFLTFECEVAAWYLSTYNCNFTDASFCELLADNLGIKNGLDSKYHNLKSIAFNNFNNTYGISSHVFICENFNNRFVKFQIVDDDYTLLHTDYQTAGNYETYNRPWVLVLKMRGIKN